MLCSVFHACHPFDVVQLLFFLGILMLCIGWAIAAVVKAWRSGSSTIDVDGMINDARRRANRRGYDDG